MKKLIVLTGLMSVAAFSVKASPSTILKGIFLATGIGCSGHFIVNKTENTVVHHLYQAAQPFVNEISKSIKETFATRTIKNVVAPAVNAAAAKSQFLRKLTTGLAITAAVSFILNKLVEKYEAHTQVTLTPADIEALIRKKK